ncbi:MAG: hypothetical protein C4334_03035 [Pyrinomonas sp.]|uniref:peptide ABC transporter substrate-binding protein n=1 Tax=Pyrinomonas sp. TaxID=2080306 RepID=UPI00331BB3DB
MRNFKSWTGLAATLALALTVASCSVQTGDAEFFGSVKPPAGQVMRYVSGSEPESLDPQMSTGQPEGRLYLALYEGLTEYHPVTSEPIPAIAERWEANADSSEFIFYLRRNARWSNGDPITAHDFVYTLRRGLAPELASRSAYMAYYIKYAQAYNEGGVFVRDPRTGDFLLEKDVPTAEGEAKKSDPASETSAAGENPAFDTPFHRFIYSPTRLVLPGTEKERAALFKSSPKLAELVVGKEFVPVRAEDIGVEAIDDYTLRITLTQSAPFFVGVLPHQFFRVVPRQAIERYGEAWTKPQNIITSGPFILQAHRPYNEIVLVKNPYYWDAARVRLEKLIFYPLEDITTMMNLYKSGQLDATYNHTVPTGWIDFIRPLKDYMDAPEVAIGYVQINTTRPPMNDVRVRRAFSLAIDRQALAKYQRVVKPLTAFTPEGIFPNYPQPKGADFNPELARKLLAEAGYRDAAGNYDPRKFPADQVEYLYNTSDRNKEVAEFLQAQWKQNLGITVSLRNMEWRTFLDRRSKLDYKGFARGGWVGDYIDPFTFLGLFYSKGGDNGTGWWDPKYVRMLDQANHTLDPQRRYALLAQAEKYLLDAQPVIPLFTNASNWMKKPYVKGLYPNPMTMHAWKFVYIEHDPAKWDRGMPSTEIVAEK